MSNPKWQYDELKHPGQNFDAEAEVYDQNNQKFRDIQAEIGEVLDFLDLQPDQTVLEIGCGTGELAVALAQRCSKVYAVDLSESMLKVAKKKALALGLSNLEFVQAGFLTYEHRGPAVDAVVTQLALHHLPDFWKQIALRRLAGMLKDRGKFFLRDIVYSFDLRDPGGFFEGHISRLALTAGPDKAGSFEAHVKNEYSTLDWIMEGIIQRAGFEVVRAEYKSGFLAAYSSTKAISSTR